MVWRIDLLSTSKSSLKGDIGEVIAFYYLTSHGFFIVLRPVKLQKLVLKREGSKMKHIIQEDFLLIPPHYQILKRDHSTLLTEEQKSFLEKRAWDFVAYKSPTALKKEGVRDWLWAWKRTPYLFEVKTVRGGGRPHKFPSPEEVEEARRLGFKPMLIVVRLLENWRADVELSDLPPLK